jgi:hypothetical protein
MAAPEMELAPDEAARLAASAQEVARHYPLFSSAKSQAWTQIMIVAGMIYVPRGIAIWDRRRNEIGGARPTADQSAANGAVTPTAPSRAAATPSELDPLGALVGQTAAGSA